MRKDYKKAVLKSKPTTIRYNLEQFEIAKQLGGFGTVQQMFDVLLREYVGVMTERHKIIDCDAKYPLKPDEVFITPPKQSVDWKSASKDNIPVETPPPVPKPTKAAKQPAAPKDEPASRGGYDRRKQKLGW